MIRKPDRLTRTNTKWLRMWPSQQSVSRMGSSIPTTEENPGSHYLSGDVEAGTSQMLPGQQRKPNWQATASVRDPASKYKV